MVQLRDYQRDLLQKAESALAHPRARVMLQLPTGGGKTRIAAALLTGWIRNGGKAAWLTHRRELSDQTRTVLNESGVHATNTLEWEFSDLAPSESGGVVLLMAQTVSRRNHFEGVWDDYGPEDLLVVDEAHHATAPGWKRAISQWPGPAIGLTATPWRLEKNKGFDHLFDHLIPGPQISELQAEDFLANAYVWAPDCDKTILGGRLNSNREYIEREIELANRGRPNVMTRAALEFWRTHARDRQTIIYAVSKRHAENLTAVFRDAGVAAAVILGDTPKDIRDSHIRQFSDGKLKVLVNVAVATEGFDLPEASCVVLARPTMSLALYLQMVGRGLRPKKDGGNCLILDLARNVERHGFPDADRHSDWSLEPRDQRGEGTAPPPVVRCPDCEGVSPASSHDCQVCENPFGKTCEGCKWRAWKNWSAEAYCGDDHRLVCDLCHPDTHILDNRPLTEGLKEMLRKEPVEIQIKSNLSDLNTADAARDLLCEVMENLIYAKKVDDVGAFTRILEGQLKPLLKKEKRLRDAELEETTREFTADITPDISKFIEDIEGLYQGQRKVTAIGVHFVGLNDLEMWYEWEENGEVHTSERF